MKVKTLILPLSLAISGALFAQAASAAETPKLDKREARQKVRIDQGAASGQLTPKEAARLEKREDALAANEQAAKADGVVTRKERVRLQRQADRNSAAIYKQKHDAQKTPATQ
ncbi:hypothetical protein [Rhodoferax sp.]|uniref:hypothetical protein n=1 Tax=Rhodoferax sp. TaxID=50421 RepID=UPI002771F244|nr:hypothetical protein [Rhodoferax sp.]